MDSTLLAMPPPNTPIGEHTKLPRQPTVRVYCEANKDFCLTVRNGDVVLAPADSTDHYQHWIKDMTYNGWPRDVSADFALVNGVTGEALKNPSFVNEAFVTLLPYNPNKFEHSLNWKEEQSTGFRAIKISSSPSPLGFIGSGGGAMTAKASNNNFLDGTKIVIREWSNSSLQRWKIVPYSSNVPY